MASDLDTLIARTSSLKRNASFGGSEGHWEMARCSSSALILPRGPRWSAAIEAFESSITPAESFVKRRLGGYRNVESRNRERRSLRTAPIHIGRPAPTVVGRAKESRRQRSGARPVRDATGSSGIVVQRLQEIKAFVRMSSGLDLKQYGWNGDGSMGSGHEARD